MVRPIRANNGTGTQPALSSQIHFESNGKGTTMISRNSAHPNVRPATRLSACFAGGRDRRGDPRLHLDRRRGRNGAGSR